ncbi:MAG: PAS domain-containing protein [Candidatus Omnitrophica bacterium]|nr:PAS domain-containing protein [Candidatus Omnitrophota bacterium]
MRSTVIEKVLAVIGDIDRQDLERHFSELAKSEQMLESALDTIVETILIVNSHGRVTYINSAARKLFSIPDSQDKKWTLQNVITDKALGDLVWTAIQKGENIIGKEVSILAPRQLLLGISLMAIRQDPEKWGYVLVGNDLTYSGEHARGQINREKIQSILTLVQGIAHEIGNPLNAIVIQLRLLQKELGQLPVQKSGRIHKIVDVLLEETRRLDRCVHQFLDFSRRSPLRLRKTNVNRVVQDVVKLMAQELREGKIAYTLELSREVPSFLADGEQLHRAFLNIVKNAMEAMPNGGKLYIRTERIGKLLKVLFKDEGVGIPESDCNRIFDMYYTTKSTGSGLGLSIVKNIVEEHEGRIEVESHVGRGSTFSIILPIRQQKLELPASTGKERSA